MPSDLQNVDRDVFNEKPSREDIIAVPEGQGTLTTIIFHSYRCLFSRLTYDFNVFLFYQIFKSYTIQPQYIRHVAIFIWNCLARNVQNRWRTFVCTVKMAITMVTFSIVWSKDSWFKRVIQLERARAVNRFGVAILKTNSIHRCDMIDRTHCQWQMPVRIQMAASFSLPFYQL